MASQQPLAARTGDRIRKRSAKAQQLDEEQAAEPLPPPKIRRTAKDTSAKKSNAAPTPRRREQEFQTATLPTNRTAQRGGANIIKSSTAVNLHAHTAGLPRPSSPVAKIVGGQRQTNVTIVPSPRLSSAQANEIKRLRSPFVSGRNNLNMADSDSGGFISTPSAASRNATPGPSTTSRSATPRLGMMRPINPLNTGSIDATAAMTARPEPFSTTTPTISSAHIPIDPELIAISREATAASSATRDRTAASFQAMPLHLTQDQLNSPQVGPGPVNAMTHTPGSQPPSYLSWLRGPSPDGEDAAFYESEEFAQLCGPSEDEYRYDPETAREIASDPEADLDDDEEDQDPFDSQDVQPLMRPREDDIPSQAQPDTQYRRLTPSSSNPCAASVVQRVIAAIPGRKPRQMDFDTAAQEVIVRAVPIFKLKVSAEYAYPDPMKEQVWAKQAWYQAVNELQVELMHESGVIQVIGQYTWNLRSELKTAAKNYVQGVFGFRSGTSSAVIAHNRDLAAALLDDSAFTYKTRGTPEEEAAGLYEAEIIQMVINRVYYKSAKDDGVILRQFYTPFPLPALALVISAIQCAIEEWATGQFSSVTFREKEYRPIYDEHIKALQLYRNESISDIQFDIVKHICSKIASEGCDTANAPPVHGPSKPAVSSRALSKAIAAYAFKKQTDSESLYGASGSMASGSLSTHPEVPSHRD